MTTVRGGALAALLVATASFALPASPASAAPPAAEGPGSVEITEAVGSGLAYDVLTQTLTSVFFVGRGGDAITILAGSAGSGADSLDPGGSLNGTYLLSLSEFPVRSRSFSLDLGSGMRLEAGGTGRGIPARTATIALFVAQFN